MLIWKNNTLYACKKPLMMAYEGSESPWDSFGKFIHQFQPKTNEKTRKDLIQIIQRKSVFTI